MLSFFELLRESAEPYLESPEYRAETKATAPYYMAISKAFTPEFTNDFFFHNVALADIRAEEAFARGFRLGYQLFSAACDSKYSS